MFHYTLAIFITLFWQTDTNRLVDLSKFIPHLKLDIRYATPNNFTHQVLYPRAVAYLKLPAAKALKEVQSDLEKQGVGLMIYDGYRPFSVTEKMWAIVPDERYAANPAKGSGHNRGIAVDLTLYDLKTGKPLKMPTDFDDFTEKAHQDYKTDSIAARHRKLLRDTMERHGFTNLTTEWWHFYLKDGNQYPLLNIPIEKL
jgi:D-alanyl-D-alanine dipeptidase